MGFNKRIIFSDAGGGVLTDHDALYRFEDSTDDDTGNYNMVPNQGFAMSTNSKFDTYAANFTLGNEYATIPMDFTSSGTFANYSVSAWIKFNGEPTNSVHKLISKGSTSVGYVFSIRDDGSSRQIYGGGDADNYTSNDFPAYDNTNYYHCVVTYDSSTDTVKTYVNNSFKRSYTVDGTYLPNASQTAFVRSTYGAYHKSNLIIDQMRVYSRVLTTDEINTLYNE